MPKQKDAIKDWKECVTLAKKQEGKPELGFGMVKGNVLAKAQKLYCARGY